MPAKARVEIEVVDAGDAQGRIERLERATQGLNRAGESGRLVAEQQTRSVQQLSSAQRAQMMAMTQLAQRTEQIRAAQQRLEGAFLQGRITVEQYQRSTLQLSNANRLLQANVNTTSGALARAGAQTAALAAAKRQLGAETARANMASQLFARTLGIQMPRALGRVIAQSRILGPVLAAAFSLSVLGGFVAILGTQVLPKLEAMIPFLRRIREEKERIRAAIDAIASTATELTNPAIIRLEIELTEKAIESLKRRREEIGRLAFQTEAWREAQERGLILPGEQIPAAQERIGVSLEANVARLKALHQQLGVVDPFGQLRDSSGRLEPELEELQKRIEKVRQSTRAAGADKDSLAKAMGRAGAAAASYEQLLARLEERNNRIIETNGRMRTSFEEAFFTGPGTTAFEARMRAATVGQFEKNIPDFDALFGRVTEMNQQATRQIGVDWDRVARDQQLAVQEMATTLEAFFDGITRGPMEFFKRMWRRMVFEMVANWLLGITQMRGASGGSLLGNVFGGLFGRRGGGGGIFGGFGGGIGPGGTAVFNPAAGAYSLAGGTTQAGALTIAQQSVGLFGPSGLASLPLAARAGTQVQLSSGMGLTGGTGAAVAGSTTATRQGGLLSFLTGNPLLAAIFGAGLIPGRVGAGAMAGGLLALGGLAGVGLLQGVPLGAIGATLSGVVGAVTFGIGALIGGLLSLFGRSTRKKRLEIEAQIKRQAEAITQAYRLFKLDYAGALSQLEQLRSEGVDALRRAGVKDISRSRRGHVDQWVDNAAREVNQIEAERLRRGTLPGYNLLPEFARGGEVRAIDSAAGRVLGAVRDPMAVTAIVHAGEFVQPVRAVRRAGLDVMEAIRREDLPTATRLLAGRAAKVDYAGALSQLEQLRSEGVDALRRAGVKDISRSRRGHVDQWVDNAAREVNQIEAERLRRGTLPGYNLLPEFARGGEVRAIHSAAGRVLGAVRDPMAVTAIVHAGEFVQPARAVRRAGLDVMEAIRREDLPTATRLLAGRAAAAAERPEFSPGRLGQMLANPQPISFGVAAPAVASFQEGGLVRPVAPARETGREERSVVNITIADGAMRFEGVTREDAEAIWRAFVARLNDQFRNKNISLRFR